VAGGIGILSQSGPASDLATGSAPGSASISSKPYHINVTLSGDDSQTLVSSDKQMVAIGAATQASVTPGAIPGVDQMIPTEGASPCPRFSNIPGPGLSI